jgi:hypothetical protein
VNTAGGGRGKQVALVVRVHVLDQAHDQPGADLAVAYGGERGYCDLGDLGVGEPSLLVVEDRVGVLGRGPSVVGCDPDRLADCGFEREVMKKQLRWRVGHP